MFTKHILLASAALCLLAACDGGAATNDVAMDNAAEAATNEMNVGNELAAMPAGEFATMVAASDMYEIESGKLASEKAKSPQVKESASMLVQDHQKSTADLKAAAEKSSPPITVTPQLDGEKQAMIDALKNAGEADFDRTFIEQQKQAHQKALELLRQYESGGDNQELRNFASKAASAVQGHLDRVNAIQP